MEKDELTENCNFRVAFAVISYCVSLEACKHLMGTRAALLSTQELDISTGSIGQGVDKMP